MHTETLRVRPRPRQRPRPATCSTDDKVSFNVLPNFIENFLFTCLQLSFHAIKLCVQIQLFVQRECTEESSQQPYHWATFNLWHLLNFCHFSRIFDTMAWCWLFNSFTRTLWLSVIKWSKYRCQFKQNLLKYIIVG